MAPSYSELGLNVGDSAVVSESGARDLEEKYNLGIGNGDLVTVIDKRSYCQLKEKAFLQFEKSRAMFIIDKDWDLFEDPAK